jgi:uncharacterized membrane protein YqjE
MKIADGYCRWVEAQAKSRPDFLLVGLGPVSLMALVLLLLPPRWGRLGASILIAPALYVVFIVLRAYAFRSGRK